jgi:adenosylcobalamin-dependent ribonucleoside-triphosphate reductase
LLVNEIYPLAEALRYQEAHPPRFGWGGVGEFVFQRTYSRVDNPHAPNGETWAHVCHRVVNGMYSIQKLYARTWDDDKARRSARESFELMYQFKWTPPGRGMWAMGSPFVMDRQVPEALQNCAFISSAQIADEGGSFFSWLMEMSMLGIGVGFDTLGAGTVEIRKPTREARTFVIPDTREGWAESVELLFNSYTVGHADSGRPVTFIYDGVRAKGEPIRGFGGVASGPDPLRALHIQMRSVLEKRAGRLIKSRDIVDICNMIGACVVAGNVRRSAEIAIGNGHDEDFVNLKNYELNPERADYGWVSNNSINVVPGGGYPHEIVERTYSNGEPGYVWMENVRKYGRMNGRDDWRDWSAKGVNPCGEMGLNHKEMCTLVEIYLPHITSKLELARVIKSAYLYGKTVTLTSDWIADTNSRNVMVKNRRIGLGMTGIVQFLAKQGEDKLREWMEYAYQLASYYDNLYADWLGVNHSIKRTTVKPSGTTALVAGVTSGVHYPIGRFFMRRVRVSANSVMLPDLEAAGHSIVPDSDSSDTMVVSFPCDAGAGVQSDLEVGPWQQLRLAGIMQHDYSDNGVSLTVTFDPATTTPEHIGSMLSWSEVNLKAVSFLPSEGHKYENPPLEKITEDEYRAAMARTSKLVLTEHAHEAEDMGCEGVACELH